MSGGHIRVWLEANDMAFHAFVPVKTSYRTRVGRVGPPEEIAELLLEEIRTSPVFEQVVRDFARKCGETRESSVYYDQFVEVRPLFITLQEFAESPAKYAELARGQKVAVVDEQGKIVTVLSGVPHA